VNAPEHFDAVVEASHHALDEIAKGNPEPFFDLYSRSDEATLANPFGPPARGRSEIEQAGRGAASNYRDGKVVGFESFARVVSGDLGYTLEIERFETRVGGADDSTVVALRVTSIYRKEAGRWALVHRHADPITSERSATSVVDS
jgi:ketosteroid isomerase-like protein